MVSTRARTVEILSLPKREGMVAADATPPPACVAGRRSGEWEGESGTPLEYERCREERIRENMEKMQKMGILDLALKFKSSVSGSSPASRRLQSRRSTPSPAQPTKDLPPRRSSRLQHATQISYSEIEVKRGDKKSQSRVTKISLEEGAKEEIYTDEHQDSLGDREASWTLFVDGYDKNGARIYDPVRGKTCHQCRQKTLGYRTHCSRCNLVQGQFCGDCLYMRYGENVLEAIRNPGWVCPVCRDICNCSLCRTKKGWAPTGCLYKKVVSLGFKSVAHFLIQTRRCPVDGDGGVVPALPLSAQRSLPFTDEEEPSRIGGDSGSTHDGLHCNSGAPPTLPLPDSDSSSRRCDEGGGVGHIGNEDVEKMNTSEHGGGPTPGRTTENAGKRQRKEIESTLDAEETVEKAGEERTQGGEEPDEGCEEDVSVSSRTSADCVAGSRGRRRRGLLPAGVMRPSPDSIAGRLRSRMKL